MSLYIPIEQLVNVVGMEAALKILDTLGGTNLYVPHPDSLKPRSQLVRALGLEAARKFADEWRHLNVMLPAGSIRARMLRDARNAKLMRDALSLSRRELALRYGMTMRNVHRILAKKRRSAE